MSTELSIKEEKHWFYLILAGGFAFLGGGIVSYWFSVSAMGTVVVDGIFNVLALVLGLRGLYYYIAKNVEIEIPHQEVETEKSPPGISGDDKK